jgi:hypothetical protein
MIILFTDMFQTRDEDAYARLTAFKTQQAQGGVVSLLTNRAKL